MEKFKVIGVTNREDRIYISLKKPEFFESKLSKILEKIGFKDLHFCGCSECVPERNPVDYWTNYKNEKYDIDVFYGKQKIVLSIRAKHVDKTKFIEKIKDVSVWVKPKKLKKPNKSLRVHKQ